MNHKNEFEAADLNAESTPEIEIEATEASNPTDPLAEDAACSTCKSTSFEPHSDPASKNTQHTKKESAYQTPSPRYVGRFTLGVCLILVGGLITASMLVKDLNLLWFAKLLPLVLVALGLEILICSVRKSDRPIKIGFGTTLLCLVLICGSVLTAMLPELWQRFGPERQAYMQQVSDSVEHAIYDAVDPACLKDVSVSSYFGTLNSDAHIRINVSLAGDFASAQDFAAAAMPVIKAASDLNGINNWDIQTMYIDSDNAYGNWCLSLDPLYPWKDASSEAFVSRVQHTDVVLTQDGLAPVSKSEFERMKQDGVLCTADAVEAAFAKGQEEFQLMLDAANQELEQLRTENQELRQELDTLRSAG